MRRGEYTSNDRHFLEVFLKISRLTSAALDHQEVMETVVRSLPKLLDIDACTIRLLDASTGTFVLGAAHGVSLEYLSRDVLDSAATLQTIRSGQPVYCPRIDEEPLASLREAARIEGIISVLSLPILCQGELQGVMRLLTRHVRRYTDADIAFAMSLAEQAGMAVARGRQFKDMEAHLTFLREIQSISALVNSTLDLDQIFAALVERAAVTMAARGCTLRLLETTSGRLELAAAHGLSPAYLTRGGVDHEQSMRLALENEPVVVYDVRRDHRIDYHDEMAAEGIVSLLAVPVKVDGAVIGVMRILTDTPRVFTSSEVRFAVTLAEVGGSAIRNAHHYRRINLLVEQARAHEKFLSDIINSLVHQLLVLDRHRKVVLANRIYLQATGKQEAEVLGTPYSELCRADGGVCPVDQIFQGKKMRPFVQAFQAEDASRWYERSASPIYDGQGNVEYVVEIIRDITSEHLLAEEQVQRGKLQAIVELAGTVAHEINSPLFAALGTAQLLGDEVTSPELRDELAVIVRNLQQIGNLTEKMTTMTGFTSKGYVGTSKILSLTKNDDENP